MILGAVLVLLTWAGVILAIGVLGFAPALIGRRSLPFASIARLSLWWGLLVGTGAVLTVNLLVPLRSAPAAWALLFAVVIMAGVAVVVWRLQGGFASLRIAGRPPWWVIALLATLTLCAIFLAVSALGPVTNYDSGLYHLGAVKYSADFATIPGLANLYAPFGYNNAQFPLAAVLGNGPWDGIGYRLVNGLIMMLMASDLALRLLQRKYTVGTFVLIVGLVASWVPLMALADYWVTSPTSDSAVLILTFVSMAYLCDALTARRGWESFGAVAIITGLLLSAMRPLMVFFVLATILVIGAKILRSRRARRPIAAGLWWLVAVAGLLLAVVQTIRDYILSGWLQFPLSVLPFDVPWRATDPVVLRTLTLGAARDPANFREVADNWSWIPTWLRNLPTQWEFYELSLLVAAAVVLLFIARTRGARLRPRLLAAAMAPGVVTTLIWFVAAPPTFRMAWGVVFGLAVIPAAWALHSLYARGGLVGEARSRMLGVQAIVVSASLIILVAYCSIARIDYASMTEQRLMSIGPVDLGYRVTPIREQAVTTIGLPSGILALWPVGTDQCWDVYPLCTPWPEVSLTMLGPNLQDGFRLGG